MEDFLKKIKDTLDKGEISDEVLKINEIAEKSETMQPKLKKDVILHHTDGGSFNEELVNNIVNSSDLKRNKEFSKFIDSYNKTLTLFYSVNVEQLSKDEIELYNNFKNKFV